jgi:hypothetical protein
VLCLERSVIYSSPEVLLPKVCQGRLYLFDIQAVIRPGALVRQGLKDRLARVYQARDVQLLATSFNVLLRFVF